MTFVSPTSSVTPCVSHTVRPSSATPGLEGVGGGWGGWMILSGLMHGYIDTKLSLAGAATSIIFVVTKVLSRQIRVSRQTNTYFVATKICLSQQNYVCRDKDVNIILSRQKYA